MNYKKLKQLIKYYTLRTIANDHFDYSVWNDLKDKYKGERVFLVGNGPSLNKTPLYLLKDEKKICFNRFYISIEKLNWKPNFYMAVDDLVLGDLLSDFDLISSNVDLIFFPNIHLKGKEYYNKFPTKKKLIYFKPSFGHKFSKKLPKVYPGSSVIYEAMQILNYLGFDQIILIGVDMNYKIHKNVDYISSDSNDIISKEDDDPNHFDPRYFGKNKKYHQPDEIVVNRIIEKLKYVSTIGGNIHSNIINAGYDSKVEYFPKKEFTELFDFSDEQVKELFEECISMNTKYDSLEELDESLQNITIFEEAEQIKANFKVDLKTGLDLYKKMIFTHLPLGPYNNSYYFVDRSCTK